MSVIKSLSVDFGGNLNTTQLTSEINSAGGISPTCLGVFNRGDVVTIKFDATLSGNELTALNNVITAHSPEFEYNTISIICQFFKDEKANAVNGGTFTAKSWQVRTLNQTSGNMSGVSLSNNQFTLPAGKYMIDVSAPAYNVNDHQIKLYNVSDSITSIVGNVAYANYSDAMPGSSSATLAGYIFISSSKTFEIQHYCSSTQDTDGFGRAVGFGEMEVYTNVRIIRV